MRALDRIAGVAQVDEIDALDDAAVLDVEAGDDADFSMSAARPADQRQRLRRDRAGRRRARGR